MKKKKKRNQKPAPVSTLLRSGDKVMIISGGNKVKRAIKGTVGRIMSFAGKKKDRVYVEGANLVTKHKRATAPGETGGKIQQPASMHISNVMYYVEKEKKPVRLCVKTLEDGKKVRGYRESGEFVQI